MNKLCTDIGFYSLNKTGEELCGDNVQVIDYKENTTVVVLADGLGSGVKASILSTLTSKIISTMIANDMPIEECVRTIASTLPVCLTREVAYSTFTIIKITNNQTAEIYQYDNPHVILIRNGKYVDMEEISSKIDDKIIYKISIDIEENDVYLLLSDGCIHAGIGTNLDFGFERNEIIKYMEKMYTNFLSAKSLATILLNECNRLYNFMPLDDTTACAIKIKQRIAVNLLIGPANDRKDDIKMMNLFFAKEGKHIVCGGTTAKIASDYLEKKIVCDIKYFDKEVPPTSSIEGIDLVTEGIITFSKVLSYAKNYLESNNEFVDWSINQDGASKIASILFEEATDINFYVGKAINPAHQNPDLPINFSIKMHLVSELSECLNKMGKKIKVSYF